MALREIDESTLLNLTSVERAVAGMLANPESRKLLLKARKTADPNASIPEIDAAAPVNAQVDEIKQMLAAEKAERLAEKQSREQEKQIDQFTQSWERQKTTLRNQGWSDQGLSAIENHAKERGIPDLEVAAAHWEKLNPPPEPVQPAGSGSWGFMDAPADDDKFVKAMIDSRGDDEGALNAEIFATLREVRSQTGARR